MSITLKAPAGAAAGGGGEGGGEQIHLDEKDLHDAFQYALMPGGIPELREVSEFHFWCLEMIFSSQNSFLLRCEIIRCLQGFCIYSFNVQIHGEEEGERSL